jgi:PHD/YefM family antitoxin component YafN of YafNO toxin-antitoxin module
MPLLQYSSKEMFSATDLVRKNKYIFDKLNSKEIKKAVILKDGKPSFIMMDFDFYEEIIEEYEKLKSRNRKIVDDKKEEIPSINDNQESNEFDKISEDEFKKALEDIEKLEKQNNIENIKSDELKDFWG